VTLVAGSFLKPESPTTKIALLPDPTMCDQDNDRHVEQLLVADESKAIGELA
jgi:hypothetical protein